MPFPQIAQLPVSQLLGELSSLSTAVIAAAFGLHLLLFVFLWSWARRDLRRIASALYDFTRRLKNQSLLDSTAHLSDQIDAFLADVNDVLDDPTRRTDRAALLERIRLLDEQRRYLGSMFFETTYNMTRTMIEAYPLAGVLGTILSIGAALQADVAAQRAATVTAIVSRFGDAIWSTFAGLVAAIVLMFVNSLVETGFGRLTENRRHVRETIARAKRELALQSAETPAAGAPGGGQA
jgi:biopolymer transport protein ExbB/TolQ